MLKLETETADARSAALAGAPIEVRSALQRTSSTTVTPTLGGRTIEVPERPPAADDREEDRPDWPPPEVEAAMSAEAADRDGGNRAAPTSRRAREAAETLDGGPLPSLDQMVAMVPPELREQLDELFRAKFTAVRRVPAAVFKAHQDDKAKPGEGSDTAGDPEVDLPDDDSDDD